MSNGTMIIGVGWQTDSAINMHSNGHHAKVFFRGKENKLWVRDLTEAGFGGWQFVVFTPSYFLI